MLNIIFGLIGLIADVTGIVSSVVQKKDTSSSQTVSSTNTNIEQNITQVGNGNTALNITGQDIFVNIGTTEVAEQKSKQLSDSTAAKLFFIVFFSLAAITTLLSSSKVLPGLSAILIGLSVAFMVSFNIIAIKLNKKISKLSMFSHFALWLLFSAFSFIATKELVKNSAVDILVVFAMNSINSAVAPFIFLSSLVRFFILLIILISKTKFAKTKLFKKLIKTKKIEKAFDIIALADICGCIVFVGFFIVYPLSLIY
jgi:hypothetical protein